MLIDTIHEASSAMAASTSAMNNENAIEQYKQQLIKLNAVIIQLKSLVEVVLSMQSQDIGKVVWSSSDIDALEAAVDTCGSKTYAVSLDSSDVAALKNATELCRSKADAVWKEKASALADSIYGSLNTLCALLPGGQEIDNLLTTIYLGKEKLPAYSHEVASFSERLKRAQSLVDGLHLDPQAESFIKKVKTQTATIEDLDEHIMAWIRANRLSDKLKIRF